MRLYSEYAVSAREQAIPLPLCADTTAALIATDCSLNRAIFFDSRVCVAVRQRPLGRRVRLTSCSIPRGGCCSLREISSCRCSSHRYYHCPLKSAPEERSAAPLKGYWPILGRRVFLHLEPRVWSPPCLCLMRRLRHLSDCVAIRHVDGRC